MYNVSYNTTFLKHSFVLFYSPPMHPCLYVVCFYGGVKLKLLPTHPPKGDTNQANFLWPTPLHTHIYIESLDVCVVHAYIYFTLRPIYEVVSTRRAMKGHPFLSHLVYHSLGACATSHLEICPNEAANWKEIYIYTSCTIVSNTSNHHTILDQLGTTMTTFSYLHTTGVRTEQAGPTQQQFSQRSTQSRGSFLRHTQRTHI